MSSVSRTVLLATQLLSVVPPGTAVDVRHVGDHHGALFPVEREAILRAVRRRRRDFSTGRASARAAVSALGLEPQAIPVGPNREPSGP